MKTAENPAATGTAAETLRPRHVSRETLHALGNGEIAYLRTIPSEEAHTLHPNLTSVRPGGLMFSLHAADGEPLMLTDSPPHAFCWAEEHGLNVLSVH